MSFDSIHRRAFFARLGATAVGGAVLSTYVEAAKPDGLIKSLRRSAIFPGRNKKDETGWFQPRACVIPTPEGPLAIMAMQKVSGADYYHPVCWTSSTNLGKTWTTPEPVPGMGRRPAEHIRPGLAVGVCDVAPEYHRQTNTVLAMGHNVYYEKGHLARPQGPRWPIYSVRDTQGRWTPPVKLVWDDPRGSEMYSCGCAQRITLDNGDLLVAFRTVPKGRTDQMAITMRCSFDGRTLTVKKVGNTLELRKKRGLLEPSLTAFGGKYWMTIRAEDDRGYLSTSDDGLNWPPQKAWTWDDGSPLVTSTTQQHWLTHSDGLFLVYTRRAKNNRKVFRWRSPLFLAQVDPKRQCLIRETERVVFPLIGDGIKRAKHVARMGNFHVNHAAPRESWITVGEALPKDGYHGDVLLARVGWSRPNRLVDTT